jgi:hypothetical protein
MIRPVKEILFNNRLNYHAYFYAAEGIFGKVAPAKSKYGLSLLPNLLSSNPNPATIFAWTETLEVDKLYESAIESPPFTTLMQETIRTSHDELCYLLSSRARRQINGWLSIVDERAPLIYGRAPEPDDTIGMCLAELGQVIPQSYAPMPTYRLVSRLGIFSLPKPLYEAIIARLQNINTQK